jgi:hypothetical protein
MVLRNTLPVSRRPTVLWRKPVRVETGAATEEKLLVDLHKLLLPEPIFVQDVARENIRRYTAS